jgi:hypothetical protein
MPPPPTYVLNKKQSVAANLRFKDSNGILVTEMYPVNSIEGQPDTPETGYIMHIGARLSASIDTINAINTIIESYSTRLDNLEAEVSQILASGATTIPLVNGGCLNSNTVDEVQNVVGLLVENSCDYNEVLGSISQLNTAILSQCANLNTENAYSQNTDMAGLSGWFTTPTTIGQSLSNLWRSYCDMRTGVTQALSQSNITCASITMTISGYYNPSTRELTVYTGGSHLPSNFSETGSSELVVKDSYGNETSITMDIESVLAAGFVTIDLTSSGLSQTSNYSVFFTWDVESTTPALGCNGTRVITVTNTVVVCTPVSITPGSTTVQFSFTPYITSNVIYTLQLLSASGTVVEATNTYVNPTISVSGSFTGLSTSTTYYIQLTVSVGGVETICPLYTFNTTS